MTVQNLANYLAVVAFVATVAGCGRSPAPNNTGASGRAAGGTDTQATATTSAAPDGPAQQTPKPVVIGLAGPFTGDSSELGVPGRNGAELAVDEINASGGIDGRRLEMRIKDDAGNPAEAQNVATRLASDPEILAIVGHFNSSCSLAAKPVYGEAKMTMLSPASTAASVTRDSDRVFRNIFTDDFQGQSLARYVGEKLGLKKVAILFDNDDYGTGLKDSFKKKAGEVGVNVVAETAFARDTNDFRSQLEAVRAAAPEIILIAGLYKQAAVIARQARDMGIQAPFIGGDGLNSPGFLNLAGPAAEGTLISCPFLFDAGGPRAAKFAEAYRARFKTDADAWAALSYDAVRMVAQALQEKGATREAVFGYLNAMNTPGTAFPGMTGNTYFENGDCRKPVHMARVKGGKFVAAEKQMDN